MKRLLTGLVAVAALFAVEAKTVGLWTMAMEGNKIKCSINSANDLTVGNGPLSSVVSFPEQSAGWTTPPNPDTTASPVHTLVGSTCYQCSDIYSGGAFGDNQTIGAELAAALSPTNDFTFEGYVSFSGFGPSNNRIFVYRGFTGKGTWFFDCTPGATAGTHYFRINVYTDEGKGMSAKSLSPNIPDSYFLDGRFHHFALVFERNYSGANSAFLFYLDGNYLGRAEYAKFTDSNVGGYLRFFGTGTGNSVGNNFIGRAYYWRASDKALRPYEFLREGSAPWTVAYWPLNVDANGNAPCAVSPYYYVAARNSSYGGVVTAPNDIGWDMPPNLLLNAPYFIGSTASVQKVVSEQGVKNGSIYSGVFSVSGRNVRDLVESMSRKHDFTVECWYRPTELPASGKNQLFMYMTYGGVGGWIWNLMGSADGSCYARVSLAGYNSTEAANQYHPQNISGNIRAEELLNRWNHYAITFVYDNGQGLSEFRFYLNGYLQGSQSFQQFTGNPGTLTSPLIYISGCGSGTAQQMIGDTLAWRVSRKALDPSELLVNTDPSPLVSGDTVVYTSFEKTPLYNIVTNGYEAIGCGASATVSDIVFGPDVWKALMVDARAHNDDPACAESNAASATLAMEMGKSTHRYFGYTIPANELNYHDFTVEMVAKFPLQTTGDSHYIIEKSKSGVNMCDWGVVSSGTDRNLRFTLNCDTYSWQTFDTGLALCGDGRFHHVAVTYSAAQHEIRLWVDYVAVVTKSIDLSANSNTGNTVLYCGTYPPEGTGAGKSFAGLVVDAFRVTKRVLMADGMMCAYSSVPAAGTLVIVR